MPSAKQVADEHLDLGENQAAIVKKVEELTLYLLRQKEQIDRQQKQSCNWKNNSASFKKSKYHLLLPSIGRELF
ncbi:hypothetical protein [Chitinophaga barathri]|uniref:Uncharacterized protein n=1 Tax=Chitinophaga barathri TaxID=1647451 RepID=A0A3N4MAR1_9BACT|nr:hypothetical protein [Chitinophaga barathri]RPD38497.1 hypothetical protein EG028_24835 [Chitinophaga barathri]